MESLQKMLKAACEDSGEVNFRNDYSGRAMYGRRCVGITGTWDACQAVLASVSSEMVQELFGTAIDAADGDENAAYDLNDTVQDRLEKLMKFSFDQMGYDVIIYWPRLESLSEEELSEDDGLPTDAEFDAMSEHALLQWVEANQEYHTGDENVESYDALRQTAKVMRDRIREDRE